MSFTIRHCTPNASKMQWSACSKHLNTCNSLQHSFPFRVQRKRRGSAVGLQVLSSSQIEDFTSRVDYSIPSVTRADVDEVMDKFRKADKNNDGEITRQELLFFFASEGTVLTDTDVDRVWDKYDTYHKGHITEQDFRRLAKDLLLVGTMRWHFDHVFTFVDKDKSGQIAPEQLRDMIQCVEGRQVEDSELSGLMEKYDLDQSGTLDRTQFEGLVRTAQVDLKAVMQYIMMGPSTAVATWAPPVLNQPIELPELVEECEATRDAVKLALEMGEVFDVTCTKIMDHVLRVESDRLVVLQCSFTWCRPCIGFKPKYKRFAKVFKNALFLELCANTDEQTKNLYEKLETFTEGRIGGTPAHIFFRECELVDVVCGSNSERLKSAVTKHLKSEEMPAVFILNSLPST